MLYMDNAENILSSIYDMNGRLVWRQQTPGSAIDVSKLEGGFYLLKAEYEKGISTTKFLKYQ
jgi:hypothetical protein